MSGISIFKFSRGQVLKLIFQSRDEPHEATDTNVGGRCCEVSGNDLDRQKTSRNRGKNRYRDRSYDFEEDSSLSGTSSSGGGHGHLPSGAGHRDHDQPVLSERDRNELMSLANENISMDFILEMKEAFQLFDKV